MTATFTSIFVALVIALLYQIPLGVWAIVIFTLIIIGILKR